MIMIIGRVLSRSFRVCLYSKNILNLEPAQCPANNQEKRQEKRDNAQA